MLIVAVLWCALDVPFTLKTWQGVRNGARPLAPQVARRLNPWPGFLRLIQGLWFLAHFLIAAWFAHFTMEIAPPAMQEERTAAHAVFTAVLAFFYTLAANGFLLAAIKTLTGRDSWVVFIWRWRIFIDLALVAVAMMWAVPGIRAG